MVVSVMRPESSDPGLNLGQDHCFGFFDKAPTLTIPLSTYVLFSDACRT